MIETSAIIEEAFDLAERLRADQEALDARVEMLRRRLNGLLSSMGTFPDFQSSVPSFDEIETIVDSLATLTYKFKYDLDYDLHQLIVDLDRIDDEGVRKHIYRQGK